MRFRNLLTGIILFQVMLSFKGPDLEAASTHRHSLDFSPMSPLIKIYALQYGYMLSKSDELILGPAYVNVGYDFGKNYAPTLILGYRKYFWGNLHLEYQLWPAYNSFHDYATNTYFRGFDLWNEFRAGYRIDFSLGDVPMHLNLQWLFGFGLYPGNKPQAFLDYEKKHPTFTAPAFFLGFRF